MNLTDYHAKYFAHELTKRCSSDSLEKLAGAVAGAQVDLNPHQVDAALFAFNSPLSNAPSHMQMHSFYSKMQAKTGRIHRFRPDIRDRALEHLTNTFLGDALT